MENAWIGSCRGAECKTQTRLALRQYQTRQGLPTTGELDEATRRTFGLK
jgi:Putative peptidoglycan binding domain